MSYTDQVGNKLNALLEKTYDAEKGYKKAAENVENPRLKNFFNAKAQERYTFGHELKNELSQFGQKPDKGGSFTGSAHRAWMDIKATFSSDNSESMLEEAIRGEEAAVSEYQDILEERDLPPTTHNLLSQQKNSIEQSLSKVRSLEDLHD